MEFFMNYNIESVWQGIFHNKARLSGKSNAGGLYVDVLGKQLILLMLFAPTPIGVMLLLLVFA